MSFLYRNPSLGPDEHTDKEVDVVDTNKVTVLSIAYQGEYNYKQYNNALSKLYTALASQSNWVQVGEPRAFNYNSPFVLNKWGEIQIPVAHRAASQ